MVPVGLITEAKTVINPFSRSLCVHRVLFIVEIYRVSPRAIVPLVLACTRAPRSFVGTPVHKGGRIVEEERGRGGGRGGGRRKNEKRKKKGTTASRTQRVPPPFDSKPNGPGEKEWMDEGGCASGAAFSSPPSPLLLTLLSSIDARTYTHTRARELFQLLLSSTDPGSKLAAFPAIALFSLSTGPASKNYLLR